VPTASATHGDRETGEAFHPAKLFMGEAPGYSDFSLRTSEQKFNAS
jgi:hypothetical protein